MRIKELKALLLSVNTKNNAEVLELLFLGLYFVWLNNSLKEKTEMNINKNTSIACIVAILISGVCVVILGCFAPQTTGYNTIQNIMLGIFSSSIVSFVISFVGYFHERSRGCKKSCVYR